MGHWPRPPQDGFEMEEEDFKVGDTEITTERMGFRSLISIMNRWIQLVYFGFLVAIGIPTRWCPSSLAFSWFITPITMVCGTYNYN